MTEEIIRKNIKKLNGQEKKDLIAAMRGLQKTNGRSISKYDQYVIWHVNSMTSMIQGTFNLAHQGPVFLPWHREFLRRFELDMRSIIPDIFLPYWDWTEDSGNPANSIIWSEDLFGGNGDSSYRHPSLWFEPSPSIGFVVRNGPFKYDPEDPTSYSIPSFDEAGNLRFDLNGNLVREPLLRAFRTTTSSQGFSFPTASDIQNLSNIHTYDSPDFFLHLFDNNPSYRNTLEGWFRTPTNIQSRIHNAVHVWVMGTMLQAYSPGDPVFFLHHCNIDRLWGEWQNIEAHDYPPDGSIIDNEGNRIYGQNRSDVMYPWNSYPWTSANGFGPTIESVLNHRSLGYKYDKENT